MFIQNNAIAPMSAPMKAQFRKDGKFHKPDYVTVIDGEWFDPAAIRARKAQGLNVTPDQ